MSKWEDLDIRARHAYIRESVKNGVRDLGSIRESYNKYAEGGEVDFVSKPFSYKPIPKVRY